jgi:hypothetical protein
VAFGEYLPTRGEKSTGGLIHPHERCKFPAAGPIITDMPCVIKLIMDLILGPEEQIAYVSVTTR